MFTKATRIRQLYQINDWLSKKSSFSSRLINKGKSFLRGIVQSRLEKKFYSDLTVLNGPFKGLMYPSFIANCSAIYPKLLGSYEAELHDVIDHISDESFSLILDVGCAEGYYTVGLAKKFPKSKVMGFDIDESALTQCVKLIDLNKVNKQVSIDKHCTPELLLNIPTDQKVLIFSDCEGYEDELFTRKVISHLSEAEFIIELHDFIKEGIKNRLIDRFKETHKIDIIKSIDDAVKVLQYTFPELSDMTTIQKRYSLAERRPVQMEWLIARPQIST